MLVTYEFYNSLKKELNTLLKSREGRADELAVAASYGDLPENSAFDAATEKYKFAERRIRELEQLLREHKPLDPSTINPEILGVGASVTIEINGRERVYVLVNSIEADPSKNKISVDSPIGKVLFQESVEELLSSDIILETGIKLRVVDISYAN